MSKTLETPSEPNSEMTSTRTIDVRQARKLGIAPSVRLRNHFIALARRVRQWEQHHQPQLVTRPVSIGVTSLDRRAGRSTIAFNLALALETVSHQPVVLVEADFGRSHIARRLDNHRPGLCQWLVDARPAEDCLLKTPLGNLQVMGSGPCGDTFVQELPFEQLSGRMQEELDDFAYAVFDLPIADDLTACFSIAAELDGIILTVPADKIDRRRIERTKRRLAEAKIELIGLAVNHV